MVFNLCVSDNAEWKVPYRILHRAEVCASRGATQGSFVQVNQPNVVLTTWKMAEDGQGTVMRFLETGGQTGTVEVQTPLLDVKSAWSSDALERKQTALATTPHGFSFPIKPFEIVTVRL